ncbi:hypothetical protein [Kutzneria buriramensis]|uniref:Gp19/Gp15/Gp42-like protein n=1 Tax=Kutzneria buriramensis TaxID=1045776 RepID=A0A3E0HD52_9PSEU|nr:hypothetical protein [Kutzneria buriramensis]REH42716.1 hypothetical protein BCF44_110213 [Kutzneria buriramensis]
MISLATVSDVQARSPQPLDDQQQARAAVLLADASAIVQAKVPDMPQPPPDTAVGVVATAVLRALATPADGLTNESVGEVSRTSAHPGGGLYFTDDELELLRPVHPGPGGAFSIWTV